MMMMMMLMMMMMMMMMLMMMMMIAFIERYFPLSRRLTVKSTESARERRIALYKSDHDHRM